MRTRSNRHARASREPVMPPKKPYGRPLHINGEEYRYKVHRGGSVGIQSPDGTRRVVPLGVFIPYDYKDEVPVYPSQVKAYIEAGFQVPMGNWDRWEVSKIREKFQKFEEKGLFCTSIPFDYERYMRGPYVSEWEVSCKGKVIESIVRPLSTFWATGKFVLFSEMHSPNVRVFDSPFEALEAILSDIHGRSVKR